MGGEKVRRIGVGVWEGVVLGEEEFRLQGCVSRAFIEPSDNVRRTLALLSAQFPAVAGV